MKRIIIILALFLIGCQPNKYEMIMTTEMLDSYVGKGFIPVLDSTFNRMGLYGSKISTFDNPRYVYCGYVDSNYYEIYFNTDSRGLILSYSLTQ